MKRIRLYSWFCFSPELDRFLTSFLRLFSVDLPVLLGSQKEINR